MEDGHTLHMVRGSAPAAHPPPVDRPAAAAPAAPPAVTGAAAPGTATGGWPFAFPTAAAAPGTGMGMGAGMGTGGMPDMGAMASQLMSNPEMMRSLMDSPMMSGLMGTCLCRCVGVSASLHLCV